MHLACSYRAFLAAKVTFDKAQEYYAIRNNSPVDYYFGYKGKKGLQSLMNKLIDQLGIDGIYPEVFASFAMHLGAENLQRLYADLGLGAIDCSDMAATMQRLEKEQGDRGKLTQEHRDKVSEANTGRKLTQEHRDKIQEHRDKMPGPNTGRKFTQEHRDNLSKAKARKGKKL